MHPFLPVYGPAATEAAIFIGRRLLAEREVDQSAAEKVVLAEDREKLRGMARKMWRLILGREGGDELCACMYIYNICVYVVIYI